MSLDVVLLFGHPILHLLDPHNPVRLLYEFSGILVSLEISITSWLYSPPVYVSTVFPENSI